ncbi:hypothetical protein C2857_005513 [Epichloe festucae Fl1]|uniref:HMG box domain-containing protein n=1 Tax=Epichloe festucae (strain Fl1) TaxID=877507 RepID=A0A7S9KT58_EPIFF|nr:hypothetical protein C2857_005513 [Epichloe festucae Fl1]
MTHELEGVFADLGLTQYLDAFVDQGFDAWDIILDIQESDLDALGVKLGHRRKLQRRIANARGIAPSISLASSSKSGPEESKQDGLRREASRTDASSETSGVTKRKYRRHPKPDENAPERPPSAYVLFSNKMRDDLKSQNLTFTEIAKLVGENWQSLQPVEKVFFESQANAAKERYHQQLAEYKKTPEYRKYAQYLHDFKERQAKQFKGQDSSKRTKVEPPRLRHGSTSSSATPNTNSSVSGSGSERLRGSEPPPTRRERVNSTASVAGSQYSSVAPTPIPAHHSYDDPGLSPRTNHFDSASSTEPQHRHSRQSSNMRNKAHAESMHQHLPSLSDMLDNSQKSMTNSTTAASEGNPFVTSQPTSSSGRPSLDGISSLPSSRTPTLRHHSSSNSTTLSSSNSTALSGSSVGSFGRPYVDGSLPIHALLSDQSTARPLNSERQLNPIVTGGAGAANRQKSPPFEFAQGPSGYGTSTPFEIDSALPNND